MTLQENNRDPNVLVHISAPRTHGIYFEAGCFHGITPEQEYARHKPYLESRFGAGAVDDLVDATLNGHPGKTYSFQWDKGRYGRRVILLPDGADTYRIIFDPDIALNHEVLATVEVSDEP